MTTAPSSAPAATCTALASPPADEREVAAPQAPPAGRSAVWMIVLVPSERFQATSMAPSGVTVASGAAASRPDADRMPTALQAPEPERVAVSTRVLSPSDRFQASTVSPEAFMATVASTAPETPTVAGVPHAPPL